MLQAYSTLLDYCLSNLDPIDTALTKLTGLPIIVPADDTIGTLSALATPSQAWDKFLYVMGREAAQTLAVQAHQMVAWHVSTRGDTPIP